MRAASDNCLGQQISHIRLSVDWPTLERKGKAVCLIKGESGGSWDIWEGKDTEQRWERGGESRERRQASTWQDAASRTGGTPARLRTDGDND